MSLFKSDRFLLLSLPGLLALTVFLMVLLISDTKSVSAQSPECNVVVALDKSPSIGSENLETLKDNVMRLLDNLSGADVHINLAFWTFSHSDNDSSDYNQPRHDYISTRTSDPVVLQEFEDALPTADELEGQTDYAQAYGYSAGEVDPNGINSIDDITLTSNNAINSIRSRADVVVLLTDGAPNYPGGSDNNEAARFAGRKARTQYPANVAMVGGYITDIVGFDPVSLKYVINGSDTDGTRVGPVSFEDNGNGSNDQIYTFVRDRVLEVCGTDLTDYWLKPKANVDTSAVQEGSVVNFSYQVDKDRDEAVSRSSDWQIYDVTINPDVTGNPLAFGQPDSGAVCTNNSGEPYCDYVTNCSVILGKLSNRGTCAEVSAADRGRGNSSFSGGQNLFYSPDRSVTIGAYPLGTRVCSILVIRVATMSGNVNRASSVVCAVVGKTPLVQVHGGDIRVGRHFTDDDTNQGDGAGVYTSKFKISQDQAIVPNGRTFGSWVEYGVLAPGPIEKIASLSGYAGENGGYDDPVVNGACDTNTNRLTFANKVTDADHSTECGYYKGDIGAIPDVVSALTSGAVIAPASYTVPLGINSASPDSSVGRYENTTDGFNFEMTDSTLEKGKTYVVYVPRGTVTIAGNITYANPAERYEYVRDIPQLIIIARDINIRESVTQINAWLVAAGEGEDGGKLDTCTGFTPPFSSKVCNQLLTINGPIMARDLNLWRTKVQEESCRIEVIEDCANTGDPAEIMNLSGSSILWTQGYNENSARARTTSTIELPPYF